MKAHGCVILSAAASIFIYSADAAMAWTRLAAYLSSLAAEELKKRIRTVA
jgi:hypothetical protein